MRERVGPAGLAVRAAVRRGLADLAPPGGPELAASGRSRPRASRRPGRCWWRAAAGRTRSRWPPPRRSSPRGSGCGPAPSSSTTASRPDSARGRRRRGRHLPRRWGSTRSTSSGRGRPGRRGPGGRGPARPGTPHSTGPPPATTPRRSCSATPATTRPRPSCSASCAAPAPAHCPAWRRSAGRYRRPLLDLPAPYDGRVLRRARPRAVGRPAQRATRRTPGRGSARCCAELEERVGSGTTAGPGPHRGAAPRRRRGPARTGPPRAYASAHEVATATDPEPLAGPVEPRLRRPRRAARRPSAAGSSGARRWPPAPARPT